MKSNFATKDGGKLRSGSDFWFSEKISYYEMTFITFFRDSNSEAKKLSGVTRTYRREGVRAQKTFLFLQGTCRSL